MKSNYKQLGQFIRQVDVRNAAGKEENLLGVSVQKTFIPSIANTVGTDFTKYKVVRRGQFTYIPDTSRRGDKIGIALLSDYEEGLVSNVYTTFEVIDKNELLPEYLMLWFSRPEFDRYARFKSHGSVREVMDWDEMCKVQLPVPPISVQRDIVKAYQTITNRIALKRQVNDNLADIIQSVYQNRFSSTRSDVTAGVLADICSYSKDKVPVLDLNNSNYYSTENMQSDKKGAVDAATLPTIAQTTKCRKGDVLISNIRPYFKKIVYCQFDCGCSTDVLCFCPKESALSAFLFSTLYADHFFDFMAAGAKGTKMPRGDKQQIMTYPIYLPSADELAEFNSIAIPALTQMECSRLENTRLTALRDALLPKLMSGELDVSAIEL